MIHIAQTNTSRSGSFAVLELLVQVLLQHPLAVRHDVQALRLQVLDLVLALATPPPPCRSSPSGAMRGDQRARGRRPAPAPARAFSRAISAFQCACTLSYMRTAVALSMQTIIALPR